VAWSLGELSPEGLRRCSRSHEQIVDRLEPGLCRRIRRRAGRVDDPCRGWLSDGVRDRNTHEQSDDHQAEAIHVLLVGRILPVPLRSAGIIDRRDGGYLDKRFVVRLCVGCQSGAGRRPPRLDAVLSEEKHIVTRRLVVVCVAALSWAVAGSAAAQAVRATVLGTITDRTGGVLPGATVNVTNTETGVAQSTRRRFAGPLHREQPAARTYNVEASTVGISDRASSRRRLVVGSQTVVDFTLGPSAVEETITVTRRRAGR
jgi:hypothetical protein